MKIKQFIYDGTDWSSASDQRINEFMQDKEVIDIKYSFGENGDNFMVIYKEKKDD